MAGLDELSLSEVVRQTPNEPRQGLVEEDPQVQEPQEEDEEGVRVASTSNTDEGKPVEFPELLTPPPNPTWTWEQAKAHEDALTQQAFQMLRQVLDAHSMAYEVDPSSPYTLQVGEVVVQNIVLPDVDPRVVLFRGIRIIPPPYLEINGKHQRIDSFRRKRAGGPFNFPGLLERIQLRNKQSREAQEALKKRERAEEKAALLLKKELGDIPVPKCLQLHRRADGTYRAQLTCEALSLKGAQTLVDFAHLVDLGEV